MSSAPITQTKVQATAKGLTVTGVSGNGSATGQLLRRAAQTNEDASKFQIFLESLGYNATCGRTGFTCAEPHAVAQLLAKGCKLDEITFKAATDGRGKKGECPVCSQWIYINRITTGDIEEVYRKRLEGTSAIDKGKVAPVVEANRAMKATGTPAPEPPQLNLSDRSAFPTLEEAYGSKKKAK